MHSILQQHYLSRSTIDRIAGAQNGTFSVRNLYAKAVNQMDYGVTVDRLICSVWQKLAPPKVEFMAWLALLNKLNTKDRLARRRVIPTEMNICTFCNIIARTFTIYCCLVSSRGQFGSSLQRIWGKWWIMQIILGISMHIGLM